MLQILRDKAQSTFIQALVLIIALVFIFWGVGANMMDSRESAIVVNDEDISFQNYQRAYDQLLANYRQQFGGTIPEGLAKNLGIDKQVQLQLIQQALLRQGSQAMGLLVSAPEVQKNIQEMVQFQENGVFNMDKYNAILQSNRLTPHKYEQSVRYDSLSSKGLQAISGFAVAVTEAEINDLYQQSRENVSVSFAKINPADFVDTVTIEEEKLVSWYEKNSASYKTEPKIKLRFLSFPYGKDDKAAVFQKANDAYEEIISAGSLQEYARIQPEAEILETGFYPRSAPPATIDADPAVQTKAFSLKKGELSSLVESQTGYYILYAEDLQEPQIPAIDTVRPKVSKDYISDESKVLARQKGEEILNALRDGASLQELATANMLNLQDASLSRNAQEDKSNGFPLNLAGDVFTLSESNSLPAEPAEVGGDFYVYKFIGRTIPDVAEITEEEREQLKNQIISSKQERLLIAWVRNQEKGADIYTHKNLR